MDEDIDYAYTHGLSDAEVERYLRETGTGVLALADGDDAYAVPLAYYYESDEGGGEGEGEGDGTLFFQLGETPDSEKRAYVETTETACFVLYDAEPTAEAQELDSWSVLVTGRLHEVPPDDPDYDAAAINEHFAPIRIFDEEIDDLELTLYRLDVESATGRATPE